MSYSTNSQLDAVQENIFCVIAPKKQLDYSLFTLSSGSVYQTPFSYGRVIGVSNTVNAWTKLTSTSLTAGTFYQDPDTNVLYIRKGDSTVPDSSDYIVVQFEMYVSTIDALWYSTPSDSTSQVVQYHGVIAPGGAPVIKQSQSDTLFGYFPVESTTLTVFNDPSLFQNILYDSSFNAQPFKIYHCLGDIKVSNFSSKPQLLTGNVEVNNKTIQFEILDQAHNFVGRVVGDYFDPAYFTGLDPSAEGKPIRHFYGFNRGVKLVNVSFVSTAPTTSDNRSWVIGSKVHGAAGEVGANVTATFADNTGATLSTTDASKFTAGDRVLVDFASFTDKTNWLLTSKTTTTVRYADSGHVSTIGDAIRKSYASNVRLIKSGFAFSLQYGRDFLDVDLGQNTFGIQLTTTAEANVGCSAIDPTADYIICDLDGKATLPTLGGVSFGSYEGRGCFENGVAILYDFMRSYRGNAEADFNAASLTTALANTTTKVGFSMPETANADFPLNRDVVTKLLATCLLKMYTNDQNEIVIVNVGSKKTPVVEITSDDIVGESYSFKTRFDDIYSINIKSSYAEAYLSYVTGSTSDFRVYSDYYYNDCEKLTGTVTPYSTAYKYLHTGKQAYSATSYHTDRNQFIAYTKQLRAMLGDRSGKLTIKVNNKCQSVQLNDTVTVTRDKLPGFDYTAGVTHSRDFVVTDIHKSIDGVELVLDDIKGIQDDSSEFP